jgi:transcription factor Pcc1
MMPNSKLPLEINVVIEIRFSKKSETHAVMNALIPDNVNFPKGLSMEMLSNNSNTLFLKFFCSIKLETLINTIDEVLDFISLAKKVISGD